MPTTETNNDRTNGGGAENINIDGDSDNNSGKRKRSKPKRYQTDQEEEEAQQPTKKKQYKKKGSTTKQPGKKKQVGKKRFILVNGRKRNLCTAFNDETNEQCKSYVQNNGVCAKHGANRKKCSYTDLDTGEQCKSYAHNNGVCTKHGAKMTICSIEGCTKHAWSGGVCRRHSSAGTNPCTREGCNFPSYRQGKCRKHHKNINACCKNRCMRSSVEDGDGFCNIHKVGGERCNYIGSRGQVCGGYAYPGTGRCCNHPQCIDFTDGIQCTKLGNGRGKKCRKHADKDSIRPKEKAINVHNDCIVFKLKSTGVKDEFNKNKRPKSYFDQVIVAIINMRNSNGSSYEEIKQYIEKEWRKNGEFIPCQIELALLDSIKMEFIISAEKEASAIEKLMDAAALCKPVEEIPPAADEVSTNKNVDKVPVLPLPPLLVVASETTAAVSNKHEEQDAETATQPAVDGGSTNKNVDENTPTQYDTLKSNLRIQIESKEHEEAAMAEKIRKSFDKDECTRYLAQLKACREQLRVLIGKANELETTAEV